MSGEGKGFWAGFASVWENIKMPLTTIADYALQYKKMDYAVDIARAQSEAQKAAALQQEAYVEALRQYRAAEAETKAGISTEAFRALSPYLIPIAIGGVVILALALIRKGK